MEVDFEHRSPTPDDSGIFRVDLETGDAELIVSIAQIAKIPLGNVDFTKAKSYFNHLLVSPDGTRFEFLHRWGFPKWTGATRIRQLHLIDISGITS